MQPYPPPDGALLHQKQLPQSPGAMAGNPLSAIIGKDAAIIALTVIGVILLIISIISPWFYFTSENDGSPSNFSATFQERLMGNTSAEQAQVETVTFILVLTAIIGAALFACLAGWLALRRWQAKQAIAIVLCLIPILFAMLAPIYYYNELPKAKLEVGLRNDDYWREHPDSHSIASPENQFYGSGEDVLYYRIDNNYPSYHPIDRASWGGSVGFYLPWVAIFLFIPAFILMVGRIQNAIQERGKASLR